MYMSMRRFLIASIGAVAVLAVRREEVADAAMLS
mgnify:CR=1 FL=1